MAIADLKGMPELSQAFKRLGRDMETRTARVMVAAAGGVLRKEARAIAQAAGLRKTGALIRNIAIKRERTPAGETQYNLGVRHGRHLTGKAKQSGRLVVGESGRITKKYENDPWYWAILHGGAAAHDIKPRGRAMAIDGDLLGRARHPGIKPTPFISMAMDRKRQEALDVMQQRLLMELEKAGK